MRTLTCASIVLVSAVVATGGCAHITYPPGPLATPTPVASATASAVPCNATAAPGAQIVAMSPLITPAVDATYGVVAGYGLVTNGNVGNVSATIVVPASATIQFFDNDQTGSQLHYSAAGIPNVTAFPAPSFTFPPSAGSQIGSVINNTTTWSTGLLGGQCYSQTFTLKGPGTYFFGDVTYYGLGNIRDVIIATNP